MIEDPGTDQKLSLVFPDIAERWKKVRQSIWDEHGLQIRVTEAYRSYAEQWALYGIGRKKSPSGVWTVVDPKKIVTNARGGESFHQFALALDSCFIGDDPFLEKMPEVLSEQLWTAYGKLCESNGLEWGGDWKSKFKDRPHCQLTYGLTLHAAQLLYENSGLHGIFDHCQKVLNEQK